jgi:hypothetical protein
VETKADLAQLSAPATKPSEKAKSQPKSEATAPKDETSSEEAAIQTLEAPKDPLRDLLAEDLRDTLLERITDEHTRKQIVEQIKDDNVLDQIKFIKKFSKVRHASQAAGQLATGNQNVKVGFFDRKPPETMVQKAEHRWG